MESCHFQGKQIKSMRATLEVERKKDPDTYPDGDTTSKYVKSDKEIIWKD
jgi:hypothetical protein